MIFNKRPHTRLRCKTSTSLVCKYFSNIGYYDAGSTALGGLCENSIERYKSVLNAFCETYYNGFK